MEESLNPSMLPEGPIPVPAAPRAGRRMLRYVLTRLVTILLTVALGVFATIVLVNRTGLIDSFVQGDIDREIIKNISMGIWSELSPEEIAEYQFAAESRAGLHLPWLPRHLRWLWNALAFQWGEAQAARSDQVVSYTLLSAFGGMGARRFIITEIILTHLPNTLVLIATADFLLFVTGLPLALYLSRRPGGWPDRLASWLAPLASIPSWVHGILLVMVFSSVLGLLPYGRMFDLVPPEAGWQYVLVVGRHMILPVAAILLNLYLQCVLAWKSFFALYAREDYVELALAKGLPGRMLERRYILRPTLPYVLTSFSLTLLGFWQMTTALEYFFSWPGIGQVYVLALQTYDILIAVGIVVIFAYLLGFLVFLLDFLYALVDPRIRLGGGEATVRLSAGRLRRRRLEWVPPPVLPGRLKDRSARLSPGDGMRTSLGALRKGATSLGRFLARLLRQPSALLGLAIVLGLLVMTALALEQGQALRSLPPGQEYFDRLDVFERKAIPANALPAWINRLLPFDLPVTSDYDTRNGTARKLVDGDRVTITFEFDYPYRGFPQDLLLVFETQTGVRAPFAQLIWTRPDGSRVESKPGQLASGLAYDFSLGLPRSALTSHGLYPMLRSSTGSITGQGGYPAFYVLFSPPEAIEAVNLQGHYTLTVEAQTFDPGTQLEARMMLVGQVYGRAGTDNHRMDLSLPLLMGAPYALGIGLAGALLTTLLSMAIAAASAWFGGWVDGLVQRISEASMVLPVLAIGLLLYFFFGASLWAILAIVIILNAFGSPVKVYRSAFLQVREAPYIEAARAYGAGPWRIILGYMIPRISRVLVPQLAFLVPSYIFLEATLAIFGVTGNAPSWGSLVYQAMREAPLQNNYFWIAEPIALLILTGLGFALLASGLEQAFDRDPAITGLVRR